MAEKAFKSTIQINAPSEKVWRVLVDTAKWPEWDPTCEKIEGELALGNKIKAFSTLSPGRAFPVKVSVLEPSSKMVWTGGMPLGLFKGERTFRLLNQGDQTSFTVREVFSGPLLALIGRSIPDMSEAFQQFCQGLKERVESR